MGILKGLAIVISLLGVVILIGSLTDGSATWMLFGLSAWALSILLALMFFSRLFRLTYQERTSWRMAAATHHRLIRNPGTKSVYPRLRPPSVVPDGETPDSATRRSG